MPIRRLPPLLVNQIAAGEVIERPASVVKELLENSLDAGATRIDLAIEHGGRELIRVTDDGGGIPQEELPLAVAPHATSKINSAADLNAIATLGFRGEALASITSVSRLSIVSRPAKQPSAGCIEAEGGQISTVRPAGAPVGTAVTVRNLFFNTPARRKFLRSEQSESARIGWIIENMAMAHPAVGFTLTVDGRKKLDFVPARSRATRVLAVLGEELRSEVLELNWEDGGVQVWGFIGKPAIARGTAKHQRLFLNGRMIADRAIAHAIKEAYRGLIEPTRYPSVALFLSMDAAMVDVNVHPTKAEVRFRNQALIHGAVLSSIRECLRKADLTPALEIAGPRPWPSTPEFGSGLGPAGETSSQSSAHAFVEYFRRLDPRQKGFVYSEVKQALAQESPEVLAEDIAAESPGHRGEAALSPVRSFADVLQIHSSYIVTEDEHGLVIIDQHALHERVIFEKLKERIECGPLESQRLLAPVVLEVDQSPPELLEELQPLLKRIGIEAEAIGPRAIAVHTFPSLLFERGVEPSAFMNELLEKASSHSPNDDPESALHETLDMMACKAAVKAGDRLTPDELAELLKNREIIERSSNCPHGRPTTLRLSLRELDRQFGRR